MHKFVLVCAILGLVAVAGTVSADEGRDTEECRGFDVVGAREMTQAEMNETEGALFARGTRTRRRLKRHSWRDRASRTDRVHCDILARNRAESLGYDTSTPQGAYRDYNTMTVAQIYEQHRGNRSATPPRGTAGYIFTGGADGKTHLQFYDNRSGGDEYIRYSNRSFPGTESRNVVPASFMPDSAGHQVFVPLPRRDHREVYSW
jgi:hypothetical protein